MIKQPDETHEPSDPKKESKNHTEIPSTSYEEGSPQPVPSAAEMTATESNGVTATTADTLKSLFKEVKGKIKDGDLVASEGNNQSDDPSLNINNSDGKKFSVFKPTIGFYLGDIRGLRIREGHLKKLDENQLYALDTVDGRLVALWMQWEFDGNFDIIDFTRNEDGTDRTHHETLDTSLYEGFSGKKITSENKDLERLNVNTPTLVIVGDRLKDEEDIETLDIREFVKSSDILSPIIIAGHNFSFTFDNDHSDIIALSNFNDLRIVEQVCKQHPDFRDFDYPEAAFVLGRGDAHLFENPDDLKGFVKTFFIDRRMAINLVDPDRTELPLDDLQNTLADLGDPKNASKASAYYLLSMFEAFPLLAFETLHRELAETFRQNHGPLPDPEAPVKPISGLSIDVVKECEIHYPPNPSYGGRIDVRIARNQVVEEIRESLNGPFLPIRREAELVLFERGTTLLESVNTRERLAEIVGQRLVDEGILRDPLRSTALSKVLSYEEGWIVKRHIRLDFIRNIADYLEDKNQVGQGSDIFNIGTIIIEALLKAAIPDRQNLAWNFALGAKKRHLPSAMRLLLRNSNSNTLEEAGTLGFDKDADRYRLIVSELCKSFSTKHRTKNGVATEFFLLSDIVRNWLIHCQPPETLAHSQLSENFKEAGLTEEGHAAIRKDLMSVLFSYLSTPGSLSETPAITLRRSFHIAINSLFGRPYIDALEHMFLQNRLDMSNIYFYNNDLLFERLSISFEEKLRFDSLLDDVVIAPWMLLLAEAHLRREDDSFEIDDSLFKTVEDPYERRVFFNRLTGAIRNNAMHLQWAYEVFKQSDLPRSEIKRRMKLARYNRNLLRQLQTALREAFKQSRG